MKTIVLYKTVIAADDYDYYIFYQWGEYEGKLVWLCDEMDRLTLEEACIKYPIDEFKWIMIDEIEGRFYGVSITSNN